MYIAAMTTAPGLTGEIAPTFAEAACLLILDAEKEEIVASFFRKDGLEDCALAAKLVAYDCEAVLCGPIEAAPFAIIADEGGVTRYMAAGLAAVDALAQMERYQLGLITDCIGGTGCHSGEEGACSHDHHE